VTLGPLTNVAVAVLREPELPLLVRRLVVMGGSYRSPGNTAPTTEWNVSVDPDAARVVFRAFGAPDVVAEREARGLPGRPLALGLDVTERAKFVPEHLARLAAAAGCDPDGALEVPASPAGAQSDRAGGSAGRAAERGHEASSRRPTPAATFAVSAARGSPSVAYNAVIRFIADALRFYMEFHSRYDGFHGAFLHDPLALAVALDAGLVRTEALAVDVELGGSLTTGETVADWRRRWGRSPNLDVAVEADAEGFLDRFIERVGSFAAVHADGADGGY
jgi:purine nucleosidase